MKKYRCSQIPYLQTGKFQTIVTDYIAGNDFLKSFYHLPPTIKNIAEAISQKQKAATPRDILVKQLLKQYDSNGLLDEATQIQISSLTKASTFTITTGQQTGILLGPLYACYKIISAIKWSKEANNLFPEYDFVPVFWMATEDHDVAEINHVWVENKRYNWETNQVGPVGRFNTEGLSELVHDLKIHAGIDADSKSIIDVFEKSSSCKTLADATRYIVHAIFGKYGVISIDADDAELKNHFSKIILQDILEQNSHKEVMKTRESLEKSYKSQVHGREINFFYLLDGYRERIVVEGNKFLTNDGKFNWNNESLEKEISDFPERFSPNVVMRPLYQECILPNLVYIGGGAEIAYWLELKGVFDFYKVPYPILALRNSALVLDAKNSHKLSNAGLKIENLFEEKSALQRKAALQNANDDLTLLSEKAQLKDITNKLEGIASQIDAPTKSAAIAFEKRLEAQMERFSLKLIRQQKKKSEIEMQQISDLLEYASPGGTLQERKESIATLIQRFGFSILDELIENMRVENEGFLVVEEIA
jgi:bacillithiol biosynthesis cysteine-adding enzyme BshC